MSGEYFGSRHDGGPTSWRADILTAIPDDSHREFYLEFGDFQLAYRAGEKTVPVVNGGTVTLSGDGAGGADPINFNGPNQAVNPSYRNEVGLPHVLQSNASPLVSAVTGAPLGIPGCGQNVDADGTKGNSWTGCAPEAISAADPGTFVVNMRNEPLPYRVRDPLTNKQTTAIAGDLSFASLAPGEIGVASAVVVFSVGAWADPAAGV